MFGLMKSWQCEWQQKKEHLVHYCGLCHALGRLYGRKTRFLLNSDVVFLTEILSSVSEGIEKLNSPIPYHRCFFHSRTKEEIPLSLKFTAAINVLLTEIKVNDNISDANHHFWRLAARFYARPFRVAKDQLYRWQFPLEALAFWRQTQSERENLDPDSSFRTNRDEIIDFFSQPTAEMTGLTFKHSVKLMGQEHLQQAMYDLGYHFGKLIYLLDAFTDYRNDHRQSRFNAWRASFDRTDSELRKDHKLQIRQIIANLQAQIITDFSKLPMAPEQQELFINNLKRNISRTLDPAPSLHFTFNNLRKVKKIWRERWQLAQQIRQAVFETPEAGSSLKGLNRLKYAFSLAFALSLTACRENNEYLYCTEDICQFLSEHWCCTLCIFCTCCLPFCSGMDAG